MFFNHVAKPHASRLAVAIALAILPVVTFAADADAGNPSHKNKSQEETKTLDAVEVRAQEVERGEQRLHRVQHEGSNITIDRERLEQSNVIGSEDLLRYAPNLTIRSRYIGDRSNSNTQGARSLVYFDGLLISDLLGMSRGYKGTRP